MILCNKSDLARTTEKKHMFEWILSYILEMKKKKPRLTGGGGVLTKVRSSDIRYKII